MTKIARWFALVLAARLTIDVPTADMVVHEWGTLTTVVGEDGVPIAWHPLEQRSDLPSFVYVGARKGLETATVRMETPVLYFYSDRPTTVSVSVAFPGGRITEWYPSARPTPAGLEWDRVAIDAGAVGRLRREAPDSHYYPARETAAALVSVGRGDAVEQEKFLFYRGVGTCRLPLSIRLDGDVVHVTGEPDLAGVMLFESRGGLTGHVTGERERGEAMLSRPVLGESSAAAAEDLYRMLVRHGLFEDEAKAMLATWGDTWFEEGLRVFSVLSQQDTDALVPLTIDPQPRGLVRVLVARIEILTPEMEAEAEERLSGSDGAPLPAGRFAQPLLQRILSHTDDPRLRARVRDLLRH
jgi:hypothetical protein